MIAFPLIVIFISYVFIKRSYLLNQQLEDATAEISRELDEQTERLRELNDLMGDPPPQPPPTRSVHDGWRPPPPRPPLAELRTGATGTPVRPRPRIPTPEEIERYRNLRASGRIGEPINKKIKPKDLYGEMMKDE